jgi:hypothetical protein
VTTEREYYVAAVRQSTRTSDEQEGPLGEHKAKGVPLHFMDEARKRVLGIMAAILASLHMRTPDDLFGGPPGSPRTDKLIAASVQWAEKIMEKIDRLFEHADERKDVR